MAAAVLGAADPLAVVPAVHDWTALVPLLAGTDGGGLAVVPPVRRLAVLPPRTWGCPHFGEVAQEPALEVGAQRGRSLPLVIPHGEREKRAIASLERMEPHGWQAVLATILMRRGRIVAAPVALLRPGRLWSLRLETLAEVVLRESAAATPAPGDTE